ncbi:MAG: hypothetical protein Q9195_007805 [Heterodermia aff. obscurata]
MQPYTVLRALLSLLVCSGVSSLSTLTARTTSGTFLGFIDPSLPHVHQWTSVPFAEPPLGALRFLPPQPKKCDAKIQRADRAPPSCPFWLSKEPNMFTDKVTQFNPPPAMSEDCLFVNVYAPGQRREKGWPVVVFVHGGQWVWGGIETPYYKPQRWVERSRDLVVVQINYRLNVFGFPNARGLKDGERNVGLLDLRQGLEWVRDNIAGFGGDPERVSLWGQSAGAASVDMLQFGVFARDPIAKGMIIQGGPALLDLHAASDPQHQGFSYLAQAMGCRTATPEEELACMRTINPARIEHFLQNHTDSAATPTLNFVPVADGQTAFDPEQYFAMGKAGNFSKTPMIIGTDREEYAQLVPLLPGQPAPNLTYIHKETLLVFQCPIVQTVDRPWYTFADRGLFAPIYRPWMGAYHFSELPLIMGSHDLFRHNSSPYEYQVSHAMQDLWRVFAADPKHGLPKAGWPELGQSQKVLAIANGPVGQQTEGVPITQVIDTVPGDANCSSVPIGGVQP